MIPKVDNDLLTLEVETQPSLTYALDIEHGRIRGMVDELESLRQADSQHGAIRLSHLLVELRR